MSQKRNPWSRWQALTPEPALLVATVISVNLDGTSLVEYPGGSRQKVIGSGFAEGVRVFVRDEKIEGAAPELALVEVEI